MVERLFSIRDCGKAVGVAPHKIAYAHVQGFLAEPRFWVGGHRVYTQDDLDRVARYFAERSRKKDGKNEDGA